MTVRLYNLSADYAALQDAAADGEDVTAQLDALNEALEAKAQNIVFVLRGLEGDDDVLTAEIKRLTERRDRVRKNHDKLRGYIAQCMEMAGISKVKSATVSISLFDGPDSCEVVDEALVPAEYIKQTPSVRKADILRAWKDEGLCVPGTTIKRSRKLVIK